MKIEFRDLPPSAPDRGRSRCGRTDAIADALRKGYWSADSRNHWGVVRDMSAEWETGVGADGDRLDHDRISSRLSAMQSLYSRRLNSGRGIELFEFRVRQGVLFGRYRGDLLEFDGFGRARE